MMKKWLLVVIIIVVLISLFHFVTNRNQREINMSDKDIVIQWNRDNYPVEITRFMKNLRKKLSLCGKILSKRF